MMRAGLLVAAAALLIGAALWAGSVGAWTARPQTGTGQQPDPTITAEFTPPTLPPPPPGQPPATGRPLDLSLVLYLLIGVLLVALVLIAAALIRNRGTAAAPKPRSSSKATPVEVLLLPPDDNRPFDPREAADYVIACWEQIEQRAAARGSARRQEQTPTEFLQALRAAHPVDGDASADLLGLYQRARFDHVRLAPDTAARARADADAVLAGLAATGIAP